MTLDDFPQAPVYTDFPQNAPCWDGGPPSEFPHKVRTTLLEEVIHSWFIQII